MPLLGEKKLPVDVAVAELTIFGRMEFGSFQSKDPIVVETIIYLS